MTYPEQVEKGAKKTFILAVTSAAASLMTIGVNQYEASITPVFLDNVEELATSKRSISKSIQEKTPTKNVEQIMRNCDEKILMCLDDSSLSDKCKKSNDIITCAALKTSGGFAKKDFIKCSMPVRNCYGSALLHKPEAEKSN